MGIKSTWIFAELDPRFGGYVQSAPQSIFSTLFMRDFLIRLCTRSTAPDSQGQGHGVLLPWDNGFREELLMKDHCKIALTGRSNYMGP